MKQLVLHACLWAGISTAASAADSSAVPVPTSPPPARLYCTNIENACIAGGHKRVGHNADNGMWKSCMEPILAGKTVSGVSVDPVDVKGCQQLKAKAK